jgi:prepilin-type N-terminal cleavage/methylation domain-containing protein
MRSRRRTERRGFTLLEAIVSVAIMSIGLVAVIEAYGAAMRLSLQDEYLSTATMLASGKMEEVLKETYITAGSDHGDFGDEFEAFTWTVDIADSEIEGLETITVTVSWSVAGKDDELTLVSAAPYNEPEEQAGGAATPGGQAP